MKNSLLVDLEKKKKPRCIRCGSRCRYSGDDLCEECIESCYMIIVDIEE